MWECKTIFSEKPGHQELIFSTLDFSNMNPIVKIDEAENSTREQNLRTKSYS